MNNVVQVGAGRLSSAPAAKRSSAGSTVVSRPAERTARRLCFICLALTIAACRGQSAGSLSELEEVVLNKSLATMRKGVFRRFAVEQLVRGSCSRGWGIITHALTNALAEQSGRRLPLSFLHSLTPAADAYLLLRLVHAAGGRRALRDDVLNWLFESDDRLRLFLSTVSQDDDWTQCLALIDALHDHDPDGRDEYLRLILALAVVWDQPHAPMHNQMGGGMLPFRTRITDRYDYFKTLFAGGRSKVRYRVLSVTALTCVVHVPVPVSELTWARKHVRGSASRWRRRFSEIDYVEGRAVRRVYQWPHGVYSLAAISEHGGICVDQAYYATITARAYGIPALIFVGEGRRGPHAWFGYLKNEREWELDAGRYAYDKYATGHATDPQTNRVMTDHDVEFMCDRILQTSVYSKATQYGRLASVLFDLNSLDAAEQCADLGLNLVSVYHACWNVKEDVLKRRGDPRELVTALNRKASAFKRYPDDVAVIRQQQASLLRGMGMEHQAEALLTASRKRVDRERDDLARYFVSEEVRLACERGDVVDARKTMEGLLRKQRNEGQKVFPVVEAYLGLTKQTGQTKAATRFLRRYLETMGRSSRLDGYAKATALALLVQAYENDGDTRNADRVRKKLQPAR